MRCVFCEMLARKSPEVSHPLTVSLSKDTQGTPYFQVFVPVCARHEESAMPGILERVQASEAEVQLYNEDKNLFTKKE